MLLEILRTELLEMKERFGTPRRTTLMELEFESDVEDLIQREDMVVTVSHAGYIKRVPLSTYRAQRRGGVGAEERVGVFQGLGAAMLSPAARARTTRVASSSASLSSWGWGLAPRDSLAFGRRDGSRPATDAESSRSSRAICR